MINSAIAVGIGATLLACGALAIALLVLRMKTRAFRSELMERLEEIRSSLSDEIVALKLEVDELREDQPANHASPIFSIEPERSPVRSSPLAPPARRADANLLAKVRGLAAQAV